MSTYTPTTEQQAVGTAFAGRKALTIQAGAGTGKTSTLRMLALDNPRTAMQYLAFNRSIVDEARRTFPDNCGVRTMHSHAYRNVVNGDYKRRLNGPRMKGDHVARLLGIGPFNVTYGTQTKTLQPSYLAGQVMAAIENFCNSADERPRAHHLQYIDGIDAADEGTRTYDNNDRVRAMLEPYLAVVWHDVNDPTGRLPFKHSHYLKMWERRGPRIDGDALVVDESQDLNPVMLSICEQQSHMQLVAVGDSQQAIYGWRGAVDALDEFVTDLTLYLTQSFRFGPAIADVANAVLTKLDAELRLSGLDSIASSVNHLLTPACVLTRTNALAVSTLLAEQASGRLAYLIGGGDDVLRFVRAVVDLQTKGYTSHPDLACFTSWNEVTAYVADDPSGDDLSLLVRLIEDYGAEKILTGLERMPRTEAGADVVISTAHKAKGREWDTVKLGADFRDPKDGGDLAPEEWRLLYVASTRAKHVLDPHAAAPLARLLGLDPDDDGPGATAVPLAPAPTPAPAAPVPAPVADVATALPPERSMATAVAKQPQASRAGTPWQGYPDPGGDARARSAERASAERTADAVVRQPTWSSEPVDVSGREPCMLIGRCGTGCRYGVKLTGILVIQGGKFRGVYNADGGRVTVPRCPTHERRPYLRELRVLPPDGSKCNSSCQHAMRDECACACRGVNHGKAHLVDASALTGVAS